MIAFKWAPRSKPELCDPCDQCDPETTAPLSKKSTKITSYTDLDESVHAQPKPQKTEKMDEGVGKTRAQRAHTNLDFDTNKVKVVNLMEDQCDVLIGRNWPRGKANHPLAGMSGYLGNPFVIGKDGTREEVLAKYKEWLYHGTKVVNGSDPVEYRRFALEELPGHYKWGCFCAPEKCHGDILRSWLRLKLRLKRRYAKK